MKQTFCLLTGFIFLVSFSQAQTVGGVGIGVANPDASAALDIQSTSKGVLVPRMNSTQRTTISNAATGLLVFDNTTGSFWFKSSTNWVELVDTLNNTWKKNGTNIYTPSGTNVGIGVTSPVNRLAVDGNISLHNGTATFGQFRRFNTLDLNINAAMGSPLAGTSPGHLSLQVPNGLIQSAGNVGIGTLTPSAKLDVNGNINVSGKVTTLPTGPGHLLPVMYGRINSSGTKVAGTDNFVVNNFGGDIHYFYVTAGVEITPSTDIIIVTPYGTSTGSFYVTSGGSQGANFAIVANPSGGFYEGFSFVVYKL